MKVLFFFIDGIGLGKDDPDINPFSRVEMPTLENLLEGRKLTAGFSPFHSLRASLLALDACLGVRGVPQSATGQAALLTGRNVPQEAGFHFGPWPNQVVVDSLNNGNLFSFCKRSGKEAALLNAYPPSYFDAIQSGRRLYSAIPQAVVSAGIPLKTIESLKSGNALSADFTNLGWHDRLGLDGIPVISNFEAGRRMAKLSNLYDFSFFEYWLSDYAGHEQDMDKACDLLRALDEVLNGLVTNWDDKEGIIFITSDHGNMEDLGTRRHTTNPVPALLIGAPQERGQFIKRMTKITDVAPAISDYLHIID